MYDAPKVIAGIIIFLLIVLTPFMYNTATGKAKYVPTFIPDSSGAQCVESREWMRVNHMDLLDQWRNEVVRDADRYYISSTGKKYEKSLTNTCMECHQKKDDFCTKCHDFAAVEQPNCWNCHNELH